MRLCCSVNILRNIIENKFLDSTNLSWPQNLVDARVSSTNPSKELWNTHPTSRPGLFDFDALGQYLITPYCKTDSAHLLLMKAVKSTIQTKQQKV